MAVRDVARVLASRGIEIVYGGAHVGAMGVLADSALQAGGRVVGVIPQQLVDAEVAHTQLSELHVVGSMHERKALMGDLADGFMALPGGLGTLEEFAEAVTWSQLGLHNKPIGLLNTDGYYDALLQFLDHAVAESFIRKEHRALVLVDTEVSSLLTSMRAWTPPQAQEWLDADGSPPDAASVDQRAAP